MDECELKIGDAEQFQPWFAFDVVESEKTIKGEFVNILAKRTKHKKTDIARVVSANICMDFWGVRNVCVLQILDEKWARSCDKMASFIVPDDDFLLPITEFGEKFILKAVDCLSISKIPTKKIDEDDHDV